LWGFFRQGKKSLPLCRSADMKNWLCTGYSSLRFK
jgi:hypothetical protein